MIIANTEEMDDSEFVSDGEVVYDPRILVIINMQNTSRRLQGTPVERERLEAILDAQPMKMLCQTYLKLKSCSYSRGERYINQQAPAWIQAYRAQLTQDDGVQNNSEYKMRILSFEPDFLLKIILKRVPSSISLLGIEYEGPDPVQHIQHQILRATFDVLLATFENADADPQSVEDVIFRVKYIYRDLLRLFRAYYNIFDAIFDADLTYLFMMFLEMRRSGKRLPLSGDEIWKVLGRIDLVKEKQIPRRVYNSSSMMNAHWRNPAVQDALDVHSRWETAVQAFRIRFDKKYSRMPRSLELFELCNCIHDPMFIYEEGEHCGACEILEI